MIHILDIAIKTCCETISFPKLVIQLYKPATIMTGIKHNVQSVTVTNNINSQMTSLVGCLQCQLTESTDRHVTLLLQLKHHKDTQNMKDIMHQDYQTDLQTII